MPKSFFYASKQKACVPLSTNAAAPIFDPVHLKRAIALSKEHSSAGAGGPFGAVVVRGTDVIAEGWNQVFETHDPTAHAEVTAIRKAAAALGNHHLKACILYTSCEPCPMCLGAAVWAEIDAIFYAADRQDAAALGFSDQWMYDEMAAPHSARRLPIFQRLQPEAQTVLRYWQTHHGQNTY